MPGSHERPPCSVYHYCSVESLFKIIESRTFRLSNAFFMNDSLEVAWFRRIVAEELESMHRSSGPDSKVGIFSAITKSYPDAKRWSTEVQFDHIYCGCFSTEQDDLSQWRAYADDGKGVAIELNLETVLNANCQKNLKWCHVVYDEKVQRENARELINEALSRSDLAEEHRPLPLIVGVRWSAHRFKNPSFSSEKEVRLFVQYPCPPLGAKGSFDRDGERISNFPSALEFSYRNGKVIPHVSVTLPLDTKPYNSSIQSIWVGPKFGGTIDAEGLEWFLARHHIDPRQVKIRRSKASYR